MIYSTGSEDKEADIRLKANSWNTVKNIMSDKRHFM